MCFIQRISVKAGALSLNLINARLNITWCWLIVLLPIAAANSSPRQALLAVEMSCLLICENGDFWWPEPMTHLSGHLHTVQLVAMTLLWQKKGIRPFTATSRELQTGDVSFVVLHFAHMPVLWSACFASSPLFYSNTSFSVCVCIWS